MSTYIYTHTHSVTNLATCICNCFISIYFSHVIYSLSSLIRTKERPAGSCICFYVNYLILFPSLHLRFFSVRFIPFCFHNNITTVSKMSSKEFIFKYTCVILAILVLYPQYNTCQAKKLTKKIFNQIVGSDVNLFVNFYSPRLV